ncbi:hypothetical protein K8P10_001387 [Leucobacter sp. Psy1]|uniref:hypothetical protein n=1 Tax=Leucobacter sp. Psy1 TaxID=2875729 RepID=UPI001CD3C72F|nr:hypothetical protein [Leucobacter sp. Psy1]UBH05876.1 hypothetical protein K8P10_001387 [Leucobacter sp. Psy1]
MKLTSSRLPVSFAVLTALLLAGCTSGSPEEPAPEEPETLAQMIEEGLANAQSDFQREVLEKAKETGEISEADWKEANNQKKECMAAMGYEMDVVYEGSKVLWIMDLDEAEDEEAQKKRDRDTIDCSEKTSAYIDEIYSFLAGDQPGADGSDPLRAVFDCLVKNDLIPKDTTFDEFQASSGYDEDEQPSDEESPEDEAIAKCWADNT